MCLWLQIPRDKSLPGKGNYWTLDPQCDDMFDSDNYRRRKRRPRDQQPQLRGADVTQRDVTNDIDPNATNRADDVIASPMPVERRENPVMTSDIVDERPAVDRKSVDGKLLKSIDIGVSSLSRDNDNLVGLSARASRFTIAHILGFNQEPIK